ncbi:MAG: hypothetical protein JNK67_28020 [Alphaproteobacteria bacterium]|nr:hypothetical protein [Alphaproteobacteria bacterium]
MPLRSALASVIDTCGPWVDPLTLPALRQVYFPLSRLWAAASIHVPGDPRFAAETALAPDNPLARSMIAALVEPVAQRHAAHRDALRAWETGFFGADAVDAPRLVALERDRRAAAARWMAGRASLMPLRMMAAVPPLRLQIPAPAIVDAAYGRFLDRPADAFVPMQPWPEVEASRAIETAGMRTYWVRFAAPHARLGDVAIARVTEPIAPMPAATVIAGNGVFIEPEMYPNRVLEIAGSLAHRGVRVVEMTSPWHARRTPPGWYGGERFFATVPMGALDLFVGQAQELAVLTAWCRRAFGGPVGIVGVSMSALVAQLAITHGAQGPDVARPDAAFLVLHSGDVDEIAFAGELIESLGLLRALADAGWSRPSLQRWRPLLAPSDALGVAPERVVSLLAREDRVMPVGGGIAQLDRWHVPAANRYVWAHSHMSVPAALRLDDAPVRRFLAVLGQRA